MIGEMKEIFGLILTVAVWRVAFDARIPWVAPSFAGSRLLLLLQFVPLSSLSRLLRDVFCHSIQSESKICESSPKQAGLGVRWVD